MAKVHCPGCKQVLEHDRGHLPLHMKDTQRGQLVTGSSVCDYSNRKIVTEKAKVTYKHDCENCGMEMELSVEEDYPGAFEDGIKPFIDVDCIGCSRSHDGYYCSHDGCGLEVVNKQEFYRVSDIGGQLLPVLNDDGKTRPRHRDFDTLQEAQDFHDSLPTPVDPNAGGYTVDTMPAGWYEKPRRDSDAVGATECRAALSDIKALMLSGGDPVHVGVHQTAQRVTVRVTDGHTIAEEPDEGEVVAVPTGTANDTVYVCDCCNLNRSALPFHHDAHDDSGRSWDYCQECEDAGCDLVECEVRNAARYAAAQAARN